MALTGLTALIALACVTGLAALIALTCFAGFAGFTDLTEVTTFFLLSIGAVFVVLAADLPAGLVTGLVAGFFDVCKGIAGLRLTKIFISCAATCLLGVETQKMNSDHDGAQAVWANIWCAVLAVPWPAHGDE
jgi:hypothetical protein